MKILLLGKNGQVGWELQRALAPLGEVIALDVIQRSTAEI
jgi:dTDP-4-dehydrorhamnose reductase